MNDQPIRRFALVTAAADLSTWAIHMAVAQAGLPNVQAGLSIFVSVAGLLIVPPVAALVVVALSGDPLMLKRDLRTVARCTATFRLPDNRLQPIALRHCLPEVAIWDGT